MYNRAVELAASSFCKAHHSIFAFPIALDGAEQPVPFQTMANLVKTKDFTKRIS
jgi:hypothetical protein